MVVGAGEEHDGDAFQTLDVGWSGKRRVEWFVGCDVSVGTHTHEEPEKSHVYAAEEAVDLAVCGFI